MRRKIILSLSMAIAVLFSYTSAMALTYDITNPSALGSQSKIVDMPLDDSLSTYALQSALNNGLLSGFLENGYAYIKPNEMLTRAQIATIVNRVFGSKNTASLSQVTDVSTNSWYYNEMQKAVKMGSLALDTNMRPNDKVTREQALTILSNAFKMDDDAMAKAGYISGSTLINPKANITRAEFAVILDNLIKGYITKPTTVTSVPSGNIMVNVSGVTLENITIFGDLIIGDGVDDGTVTLKNVRVKGNIIARGGGLNSIIISGGIIERKVLIAKVDGKIRVFATDGADVNTIEIQDGKDEIIVEGKFDTLIVTSAKTPVIIRNATITNIKVNTKDPSNITVEKGSTVGKSSPSQMSNVKSDREKNNNRSNDNQGDSAESINDADNGESNGIDSNPVAINSIIVYGEDDASTITVDKGTLQMHAEITPNNASNNAVIWSVSNEALFATISATGLLTAQADGIVTVTAKATDGSFIIGSKDIIISNQSSSVKEVLPVTMDGVLIKTAPSKITYSESDALDLSGLVVTLAMSDSTTLDVSFEDFAQNNITTAPVNGSILGVTNTEVTISIDEKTTNQLITVNPAVPVTSESISVKIAPSKITYTAGYPLDLSGLVVTLAMSDLTTLDVAFEDFATYNITTAPVNGGILGLTNKEVAISVNGKTTNQPITVKAIVKVTEASIGGTAKVGEILKAQSNFGATNLSYRWQVADTAAGSYSYIPVETNKKLEIKEELRGKFIRVVITGDAGSTKTSSPTSKVQ